jgi:hypothetical protein
MIRKVLLAAGLAGLFLTQALAQSARFELGVKGGGGKYTDDESARGLIGVEACVWCAGRYALFAEYTFWPVPAGQTSNRSANLVGAGLRVQRLAAWCLNACFFDGGIAMTDGPFVSSTGATKTAAGLVIGAGVRIPAGQHLYVRPQIRVYSIGSNSAVSAEMGIGWRF